MNRKALLPLGVITIVTFIALIILGSALFKKKNTLPQTIKLGGDFTLQSSEGPVSLNDFEGKIGALYIGYASCPDVCPIALAIMRQAFLTLPDEYQDKVFGLFISVDPNRDTPKKLKTYTRFFSPKIIGLTGTKEEIDRVVAQYGAFYRRVEMEGSAMNYAVDHSSLIYLINEKGELADTISHSASPSDFNNALLNLLNNTQ